MKVEIRRQRQGIKENGSEWHEDEQFILELRDPWVTVTTEMLWSSSLASRKTA